MKIYTIFSRIGLSFCIFTLLALLSGCNKCEENEAKVIRDFAGVGDLGFKELSDELYVINSMEEFEQIAKDIKKESADIIRNTIQETNFETRTVMLVKTYSDLALKWPIYNYEYVTLSDFSVPKYRSNLLKRDGNKFTLEISIWDVFLYNFDLQKAGFYLPLLCTKVADKERISLTIARHSDQLPPHNIIKER